MPKGYMPKVTVGAAKKKSDKQIRVLLTLSLIISLEVNDSLQ